MDSDVHYALAPSKRFDRDAHGKKSDPVGLDVFEITGHTLVGDTVYLTLKSKGWVRSREALLARHTNEPTSP